MRTPAPDYPANYVPGVGSYPSKVMLIGEAPGRQENNMRRPFVGESGAELDGLYLPLAGLKRSDCYITNVWKYRPPDNRDPNDTEIMAGMQELFEEIDKVQPEYIICLGRIAAALFVKFEDFEKVHGRLFRYSPSDGWNTNIIPVYHPAAGIHSTRMMNFIIQDWIDVERILKGTGGEHVMADIDSGVIAVDTETVDGRIWSAQVAFWGVATFHRCDREDDVQSAQNVIESADLTILHNAVYDYKMLKQIGIHPERITDTMQMLYLLGNQHQGLKTAAYRWLGDEMTSYEEMILPYRRDKALAYLKKVAEDVVTYSAGYKTKKEAEAARKSIDGIVDYTYEKLNIGWEATFVISSFPDPEPEESVVKRHRVRTQSANIVKAARRIIADSKRNLLVDPYDRWYKLPDGSREMAEMKYGAMPDADISDVPIKDAEEYACKDAEETLKLWQVLDPIIRKEGLQEALDIDMSIVPSIVNMENNGLLVDREFLAKFSQELADNMKQADMELQLEAQADGFITKDEVFNPNSSDEVDEYLKYKRLSCKSTEAKYIERYAQFHPVIAAVLRYKRYSKLKSTYVDKLLSESLKSSDGRVRAHFNLNRADTGRLTSSDPVNWQNIPTRTDDGKKVRKAVIASPGYKFVCADYSQIEIRSAAHISKDPLMCRILRDGLDIHGETSDRIFGDRTKEHRYAAKRVGFGVMYGIGGQGLLELFESEGVTGWSVESCEELIHSWFGVYSGVRDMMCGFYTEARATGKVRDIFGRYRRVPEALSQIVKVLSAGLRQAGNAPIQSSAAGIMKKAMAAMYEFEEPYEARLCNCIHDELMYEVPDEYVEEFAVVAKAVMEGVIVLDVPILVDVEVGTNWGEMEEVKDA